MKDSESIKAFLDFLRETSQQTKCAIDAEHEADVQTQDILHRLELYADNYHETAQLGRLLRQVRKNRRAAKETYERLEPISRWAREHKSTINELDRLLGAVRKVEDLQDNRMWMPRTDVLKDIEIKEDKK